MYVTPESIRLECKLTHPYAKLPVKHRATDAGYDLFSIENKKLLQHSSAIIQTGIVVVCPPGYYMTIDGRSSLWSKGIFPNRGIIDSTFTGNLVVSLNNMSESDYQVSCGDRIAQLLLHKQWDANFVVVDDVSPYYDQRGSNGFGSTGK